MDDMSAQIAARKQTQQENEAFVEMMSRAKPSEQKPKEPDPSSFGGDKVSDQSLIDLITGQHHPTAMQRVGSVAADIGKGVVETPRAIVKGVRDAYQNTINLGDEFGTWLEDVTNAPVLAFDRHGVHVLSHQEAVAAEASGERTRLASYAKLPDINAPTSVTGNLIKGTAQFLTGFKGAGKIADLAGLGKLAGAAGYGVATMKGALASFTSFDPHQERLSNLVEKFPQLHNPVTSFLQAKPDDTNAEGRFKNALEGLGLGLLTDGMVKGIKYLKSSIQAKTATEAAIPKLAPEELKSEVESLLGPGVKDEVVTKPKLVVNPNQEMAEKLTSAVTRTAQIAPDDVVSRMAAPLEQIESSAAGREMSPPKTFINFAHMDTGDDVKSVVQKLADSVPLNADTAKEGVRSFEEMKLDAAHTNAWESLINRRAGQPLSDAQMLASRQLWASATYKLTQLAQEAAQSPSEANLFAFRKMLATHNIIQNEVLGARAATARAQASMRIPVGTSAERLREMQFAIEQSGGGDVAKELAQAIDGMAKSGMVSEIGTAAEKGAFARTVDAAKEAWTLGLLTSPKTHLRNIVSNTMFVPQQLVERATAARISNFLGDENGVQIGEAAAQWNGLKSGTADMFRYYTQMLKARIGAIDDSVDDVMARNPINETGLKGTEKLDLHPAISSEALKIPGDSVMGKAADAIGSAYGITTNALTAEDNFFKVLGYRMETHAQAFRQVQQEISTGALTQDGAADRMADLILNPPENIRMAAVDNALYQTFNEAPGKFGQAILKLKRSFLVAHMLIPFARTTTNLQRAAFERTPLAPLVGQWRADMAAGGSRQALALARWGIGSATTLAIIDATMSGQITGKGPVDKGTRDAWMREGWRPYSLKIGDRWVTYNGISPVGDQIGMAADLAEMSAYGHEQLMEGSDIEKMATATTMAMMGNIMNKSYLSGFSSAINAINDPNANAKQWLDQFAGSWVPAAVNVTRQGFDPNVRSVNSMMDALRNRIPGLSEKLPVRHDLWGNPMKLDSGLGKPFDLFSPVYSQKPNIQPIDKEIIRLGANIPMPPSKVSFGSTGDPSGYAPAAGDEGLRGASVDLKKYPEAYERYVQLAGNELKHPAWGLGAKDLLNEIVTGKHPLSAVYNMRSDGPDGGKDVFIKGIITQYRALARRQLLDEFPEVKREALARSANTQALKMPVLQ